MDQKQRIERYLAYNVHRIRQAETFNRPKADFLFKILPLLLHLNHPDLPGFIEDERCPHGIKMFSPEKVIDLEQFKKLFPSSSAFSKSAPARMPDKPCILSLKTIGSIGTIAQSAKSDCDYWVSINQQHLTAEQLALLEKKCKAIEKWALGKGVEVYFFLMDVDQTRENKFESRAEEESAGSALKLLLKDELFRTHILVAGKMPLWWLIPPGFSEEEYRQYVTTLNASGEINPESFIDLGYISDIPKAEVFGACLWQMNKALDSPFKSVLKFAYLELLLTQTDQALPLFSDKIKRLVSFPEKLQPEERLEINEIDPYLLLAREIASFYRHEQSERKHDSIIRECLFMKMLEGVESQKKRPKGEQIGNAMDLMKRWDLLPDNYEFFMQIRYWKVKDLLDMGAKVHDYLIETYKALRWKFKQFQDQTAVTITEQDITVLGRKLFTFYDKKLDKIEFIRSLSRESMGQADVTFHISRFEGIDYFFALQGAYDHQSIKDKSDMIIKRETSLVRLVTWLYINGIIHSRTTLHLTKSFSSISVMDLRDLEDAIIKCFPQVSFAHISADQLLKQERITKALVVVNMFKDPVRGSKTLPSTVITTNSYGEFFIHDYETLIQLKNTIRILLTKHYVSRWKDNLDFFIPNQAEKPLIQSMIGK